MLGETLLIGGGGTGSGGGAAVDLAEKELYLRSLPRPESGVGPARVSSHSLSRSPIILEYEVNFVSTR